jgi:hypothetical protein
VLGTNSDIQIIAQTSKDWATRTYKQQKLRSNVGSPECQAVLPAPLVAFIILYSIYSVTVISDIIVVFCFRLKYTLISQTDDWLTFVRQKVYQLRPMHP